VKKLLMDSRIPLMLGLVALPLAVFALTAIPAMAVAGLGVSLWMVRNRRVGGAGHQKRGYFVICACALALTVSVLSLTGITEEAVSSFQEWWAPHWADASHESVRRGSAQVSVLTATIVPYEHTRLDNPLKLRDEEMLQLRLRIENVGPSDIQFYAWGEDQRTTATHTRLVDDTGQAYSRVYFHLGPLDWDRGSPVLKDAPLRTVRPGEVVEDVLVFQNAAPNARFLRLELSASRFGESGNVRFEIPKEMVTKSKTD
jgi:hypothetical protein